MKPSCWHSATSADIPLFLLPNFSAAAKHDACRDAAGPGLPCAPPELRKSVARPATRCFHHQSTTRSALLAKSSPGVIPWLDILKLSLLRTTAQRRNMRLILDRHNPPKLLRLARVAGSVSPNNSTRPCSTWSQGCENWIYIYMVPADTCIRPVSDAASRCSTVFQCLCQRTKPFAMVSIRCNFMDVCLWPMYNMIMFLNCDPSKRHGRDTGISKKQEILN